jgi:hypothetical protein
MNRFRPFLPEVDWGFGLLVLTAAAIVLFLFH